MIIRKIGTSFLVIFSLATILFSCSDDWNNHYSEVTLSNKSDKNLYEFIKSRDNLTKFTKLLEASGYDSLLKQSQAFTVWAPNDEALSAIDINDKSLALQIVKNSIARYSYTTSGITTRVVPMLNKKLIPLQKSDNGYAFNEEVISEPDLGAANGILHVTSNYVPYKMNVWEFINNTTGLDSLKQYVNSLNKLELDTTASFEDGVFVDSIFKVTNKLLDNLGSLNVEDSIYTALLLDNTAWKAGYDKVFPYYKATLADGGVATQVENAKWALAKNLFYHGEIDFPTSKTNLSSTGHIRTYEPNTVFQNSQKSDLSNGLGYVTSSFNIKDTASWNRPVVLEAEHASLYGPTFFNYNVTNLIGAGFSAPVSNGYYASLTDGTVNALTKPYVTFPIPNTLATKYNIYCVFIPKKEVDPNDMRPYKVRFYITTFNSQGTGVTTGYVDSKNTVQTSSSALATFTTNPNSIQKMLVAKNVTLPYSNVTFNGATTEENNKNIKFSLKIETNVGKTEAGFTRNMLIDCIILEPVIE